MLVKEYRICMPMTVEEYRIAQLYMIQKKSREESTGRESGVEILKNEPYTNGPGGDGQYTFKIYHVGSHLPGWLRGILPETALRVEEEAWNAYPYTKTRYKVPFVEKFSLEIETMYLDDAGDNENVFNLSSVDLSTRFVDYIDIVTDPLAPSKPTEDPSTYVSQVTGRGPLSSNWRNEFREAMRTGQKYIGLGTKPDATGSIVTEPLPMRIMCSYKMCRVEFRYWGIQSKIESFIQDVALRRTMVSAHRQAWTWQDEWYGLTMTEVRRLEAETARALALKMGQPDGDALVAPPSPPNAISLTSGNLRLGQQQSQMDCDFTEKRTNGESNEDTPTVHPMNFGSCISFASESERASVFHSMHGSDGDDDDFFDAQSVNTNGEIAPAVCSTASEDIHYAKIGEVTQTNVLLFIVHGGCLQEKLADESSKLADFTTFKSLLTSTVSNFFPGLQSRLILRLIPCPAITPDNLRLLHMLDPAIFEPSISGNNKGMMRSIIPIGNIPLLLTTSPQYPQAIYRLAQQLNEEYVDFRDSVDGIHFSGNVFVVADSIGSIMIYDLLASSPGFKHNDTLTNIESLRHDTQGSPPSLLFDVQDVFFLGSPLGLLLCLRRRLDLTFDNRVKYCANGRAPLRPACSQVFNIFNLADPFAYRVEPLLDASFEKTPVVHLPTFPSRCSHQWQHLRQRLALLTTKNGSPSALPLHVGEFFSIVDHDVWWGLQRVDVALHCPRSVQSIISRALPPLVHSSYWESKDASCFIVWEIAERLCGSALSAAGSSECAVVDTLSEARVLRFGSYSSSPFRAHSSSPSMSSNPTTTSGLSRQFRNSISNRLRFKSKPVERTKASCLPYSLVCFSYEKRSASAFSPETSANHPNHRANDAIFLEGQPQIITARFTFGALDLSSMANEEVEVFYRKPSAMSATGLGWECLGSQTTDSNGRLTFHVPERSRLPVGLHRLQLVPTVGEPDEQAVELTLAVVPPDCNVVICSIDGSFAASLSLMGKFYRQTDPKVRAGSVDIMRYWHALGYLLIYVSARPDMQHRQVCSWLAQHNFPPGLTFFLDGIFADPLRQKAILLKTLIEQNHLSVHCAYGSAKDVPIYRALGLQTHQIFAVGKLSRRQALEATPIREGYASHVKELMDQQHLSTPATGPLSMAILRNATDLSPLSVPPQQSTVFFDLSDKEPNVVSPASAPTPSSLHHW